MNNQKNMPVISVVVPVYGTEKYLRKCLDSILGQTYKNIELIVVNDASTDNSEEIIKEYLLKYDNMKYVRHKENRGLFQARISGAEEATGDYIAFVDSDDYISIDFYRLLIRTAIETSADMTVGNFYLEYDDGRREYFNLDPFHVRDVNLSGEEVLKTYMEQEGLCYTYQLVWNKLYNKKLWDSGVKYFKEFSDNNNCLVMTEDIGFSSYFWTHAQKVASSTNASYFYCQRPGQSTDNVTQNKMTKHLRDTISIFDFFKKMLKLVGKYDEYKENYNNWRKLYGRINYSNFSRVGLIDDYADILKAKLFNNEKMYGLTTEDGFFYSIKTPLTNAFEWYEDMKRAIANVGCKYVSFDIFDTVILRPFWLPTDLFYLMNSYFIKLTGAVTDIDFAQIRIESERLCRQELRMINPSFDDINIKEIYDTMHRRYYISKEICDQLMEKEKELEVRFCTIRKTGKELYQLALDLNKIVFFTSDMYLDKETIEAILHKNGYKDYSQLYLSSEVRLGKWSGKLYKHILKELDIKESNTMLHIGDNWDSDIEMPRKYGISSVHLDKPVQIFSNNNNAIYTGEGFSQSFVHNATSRDLNGGIWGFMGLRTMLAVVANKMFDNPYVNFNTSTDFNSNPTYIGYYALGMHLYGVVSWLFENVQNKKDNNIHFVARDGFIVKQAYDLLNNSDNYPASNYLYLSRKALTFADVKTPIDMYSLINKLNIRNTSPDKFLLMFKDVISENKMLEIKSGLLDNGFFATKKFADREEYERFLNYFLNSYWSNIEWKKYREELFEYFKCIIKEGDVLFDIGYSGRSESALNSILGFSIDSFYIHSNSEVLNRRMKMNGFKTELFYNYKPYITGVMREHMFMKLAPSTIGYEYKDGNIVPVFEDYNIDPATKIVTEMVQNSAIDFIKDIKEIFDDYIDELYARREDLSQPFEYYLHYGKKLDRNVFATLIFEDDFGEGKKLRAVDFWSSEIERMMGIQKSIVPSNRVIDKQEYIGISEVAYYEKKGNIKNSNPNNKSMAIFLDTISELDSVEDKFAKCAGNTSNIIDWNTINETIKPKVIPNWFMTNPGGFESDDFDIFLTTNLIWVEENTDLTYLDKVLERIGDKVLFPMGIGLSSKEDKKDFKLSDDSIKTLHKIAERCKSIGVKGNYTAEILNGFGIKNIDVIGLPAMYNNISNMKSLKTDSKINKIKTISSFRPFYGKVSANEKKLLSYMMINGCSLMDTTALELQKSNFADDKLYDRVKAWEKKKNTYFDIEKWKESFKDTDFCFGLNFQNNMLAMQCGIPALFINYESTGRELCKFFDLPAMDISEFDDKKGILNYYKMADMSKFIKNIDDKYKEYCAFLKKNGINIIDIRNRIIEK